MTEHSPIVATDTAPSAYQIALDAIDKVTDAALLLELSRRCANNAVWAKLPPHHALAVAFIEGQLDQIAKDMT